MTEVETARHNEPWRKEFFYLREIRDRGYNEGRAEQLAADQAQLAADQARIAELEAEVQALHAQLDTAS